MTGAGSGAYNDSSGTSSPETTQRYVLLDEAALWAAAGHAA